MRDIFTTLIGEALTFSRIEMDDNAEALLMQMARLAQALPVFKEFPFMMVPLTVEALDAIVATSVARPQPVVDAPPVVINKRETFVPRGTISGVVDG